MIKLAVLISLSGASFAHAAGLPDQLANVLGNPFVGEERRPLLMPASSAQPPLVPLSRPQGSEAPNDKPVDNFESLRVVSRTQTHALVVSATSGGSGGARAGQRSWLVTNGTELVANGRSAKVIFASSGAIGLKTGKGDVAWLADIAPPSVHPQPGPSNESSSTPMSAGVGIGAKGGISAGVGNGFSSAGGNAGGSPGGNPGQPGAPR